MLCLFATLLSGGLLLELRGDKQQMFVLTRDANFHTCKWLSRVRTNKSVTSSRGVHYTSILFKESKIVAPRCPTGAVK